MLQIEKFKELIIRNEDWLFAQLLSNSGKLNKPEYQTIINYSWKYTITGIRNIIVEACNMGQLNSSYDELPVINRDLYLKFIRTEKKNFLARNIQFPTYIHVFKDIRNNISKLVNESKLNKKEKNYYTRFTLSLFDSLEIGFIDETLLKNNKQVDDSSDSHHDYFNIAPFPILAFNPLHQIINSNERAQSELSALFNDEHWEADLTKELNIKDDFNAKINELASSDVLETHFELTIPSVKGEYTYIVHLRKMGDSGNILASMFNITKWVKSAEDLSKAKSLAEDSDRLKTAFLANMSHEIRTPLNAIVGFAELLSVAKPNNKEKEEFLSLIKKSSNDLLNIIEDVIDISKIESKQLKIHPKNTKLGELCSDLKKVYDDVIVRKEKKELTLRLNINDDEKDVVVRTDPKRLKQVLSNLLGNAVKFTDKGLIEFGYKVAENKLIYFYVKDSGLGIPRNMQKKVFDRFVQVEEFYTKNTNGTGLGLAISRNIVQLLGGNIWLTSTFGTGSNFYFFIPMLSPVQDTKVKLTPRFGSSVPDFNNMEVLIAEDEDLNYSLIEQIMLKTGAKITRAKNGIEAISHCEKQDFDIILMDIKMPEVNGLEASKYISHIKPEIPIIAITAFAMDNDRQKCLDAGCIDYMSKPIRRELLFPLIERHYQKIPSQTI